MTVLLLCFSCALSSCANQPAIKKTTLHLSHGDLSGEINQHIKDPHHPLTKKIIDKQNQKLSRFSKDNATLIRKLKVELLNSLSLESEKENLSTIGSFMYRTRYEEGQRLPLIERSLKGVSADFEQVLNPNTFLSSFPEARLLSLKPSPSHRQIAFRLKILSNSSALLVIKDLSNKSIEYVENFDVSSFEWYNNKSLLFIAKNEKDHEQLYLKTLDNDNRKPRRIFVNNEPGSFLRIKLAKDKSVIFLSKDSQDSSVLWMAKTKDNFPEFKLVAQHKKGVYYKAVNHLEQLFILSQSAKKSCVYSKNTSEPISPSSKDIYCADKNEELYDIDIFRNHLIIYSRINGQAKIKIVNLKDSKIETLTVLGKPYRLKKKVLFDFNSSHLSFYAIYAYKPTEIFYYDFATKQLNRRTSVQKKLKLNSTTINVLSDGALVPVSLIFKGTLKKSRPMLLQVYGAYGKLAKADFQSEWLSLLQRGFIIATVHVRGGGFWGKKWHDAGRLLNKKNSFRDFKAAISYLIKNKFTTSDMLVISAKSAGALIIANSLNDRSQRFASAVLETPFVDLLSSVLDSKNPLSIREYKEWGNPNHHLELAYMKSYCPFNNMLAKPYPDTLVYIALQDSIIPYWQPLRWALKLKRLNQSSSDILIILSESADHLGEAHFADQLNFLAMKHAFILHSVGINF